MRSPHAPFSPFHLKIHSFSHKKQQQIEVALVRRRRGFYGAGSGGGEAWCCARSLGFFSGEVGYHGLREDMLTHLELGHLGMASAPPLRHLQGFRLVVVDAFDPG